MKPHDVFSMYLSLFNSKASSEQAFLQTAGDHTQPLRIHEQTANTVKIEGAARWKPIRSFTGIVNRS